MALTCALETLMSDAVQHGTAVVAESWGQIRESLPLVHRSRGLAGIRTRERTPNIYTVRKQRTRENTSLPSRGFTLSGKCRRKGKI